MIGATPPAVEQSNHARSAVATALSGIPVVNARGGVGGHYTHADIVDPQKFVHHPLIPDSATEGGLTAYGLHRIGHMSQAGWDGEGGATAPTSQGVH